MAWVVPDTFVGTAVTFSSGFIVKILDVAWDGISREMIETTHATTASNYKTFMVSDFADPGSLTCTIEFDALTLPPINGAFETVSVDFGGDATNFTASGAMSDFSLTGNSSGSPDMATATCGLKFSGPITIT